MKYFSLYLRFFLYLLILLFLDVSAFAEDVRNIAMQAEKMREKVLEKARLEEEMAGKEGDESLKKIFSDKEVLTQAILQIKRENRATKKDNDDLEKENKRLVRLEEELAGKFSGMDAMARELTGFARIAAKDIDALLRQSLQSDMVFGRVEKIAPILNKSRFPGMDDIRTMVDILFEEMKKSGEVRIENGLMINRAGEEITSKILTMGNFTAAYQLPDEMGEETGFLVNSDKSGCLFALSRLPPSSVAKGLRRYMGGGIRRSAYRHLSRRSPEAAYTPGQFERADSKWRTYSMTYFRDRDCCFINYHRAFYLFAKSKHQCRQNDEQGE
jgi:biopolymer transport protein ExbB